MSRFFWKNQDQIQGKINLFKLIIILQYIQSTYVRTLKFYRICKKISLDEIKVDADFHLFFALLF